MDMRNRRAKWILFPFLMLGLVMLTSCGGGAAVTIGQLAALSGVLSQLQKALSSVVAQADDATKNNISRVDTTAKDNIDRINQLVTHAADSTADQREELARQAFGVLSDSQKIVDQSGKDIFANVNQTLAAGAAILDATPGSGNSTRLWYGGLIGSLAPPNTFSRRWKNFGRWASNSSAIKRTSIQAAR